MAGTRRSRVSDGPPTSVSRTPRQTPLRPAENASSSLVPDTRTATTTPQPFDVDLLHIVEINADGRIGAVVIFDLEDFDAAIAELDARYLAGEAAAHSRTWSVIMQGYASLNRRELPPTTPDWVNIDHRRGTSIAPGGIPELLTAAWNVTSDLNNFVEAVHRLDNLGGVVTHVANETSQEGFHAEWRVVSVFTVEGDLVNRCEVFDEAAIDDAIARFEELSRPAPRLENTASRANARYIAYVNARDWDAAASILADDYYSDDRRRVTGAGTRRGRDADIENMRVVADLGANITVEVIATRGDRLVLTRTRAALGEKQQPFIAELLGLVETDLDGRVAAVIVLRPRGHRGSLRRTRRPVPRRRSGRSRAHMVGDLWQLRGDQPTRACRRPRRTVSTSTTDGRPRWGSAT